MVLADGSANTFVEDGSCVLENMMLAAHALGLGTVWVHREREFSTVKAVRSPAGWKLPETLRGVGAIALGYPAKEAGRPQHANKTILFGFNNLLSGAIFLRRTLCGEEGKYTIVMSSFGMFPPVLDMLTGADHAAVGFAHQAPAHAPAPLHARPRSRHAPCTARRALPRNQHNIRPDALSSRSRAQPQNIPAPVYNRASL